jgi:hypothetical protein
MDLEHTDEGNICLYRMSVNFMRSIRNLLLYVYANFVLFDQIHANCNILCHGLLKKKLYLQHNNRLVFDIPQFSHA